MCNRIDSKNYFGVNMKFGIIGVGGYIAPRHLKAIKDTGNTLICALDPRDSVGILDSYFPQTDFFTEFERFDRHIDKLRRKNEGLDYICICSPNYLHDSHIRFALRSGVNAICEKPLVLNTWNIDGLKEIQKESGKKIYNILQLRLHPSIIALKEKVQRELEQDPNKIYDVTLTYITSRGKWYFVSWKGDVSKSGGIATNIGVHFFDMLSYVFGDVKKNIVHISKPDCMGGYLELKNARVRWFLSINKDHLPKEDKRTYRSVLVNDEEVEFTDGFTDLHTLSYEQILNGKGFTLEDAISCIEIVHDIRNITPIGMIGDYHPLCQKVFK
ncbi:Gfo/Idh/MocA family protein [Helicobacter cappadocius]|uniref:Gfo/Idh/MocA family oxidoreductase n=1 Tax=Helicobacter cappadocius TaxID=3063998 RepID=A0AA90SSA2_9HELI|nr:MULTISPECIES: Gfo/Idh/MocA family oxidoreductase [unclassified Helicobacter]MDO7253804.1 Gfo/Idh/MocA family oxidoreductase [Helicobacter sp. faydin-H75]MDP2538684.1 Gfo/Idh/MocA family oxidoreductase [Helicobacter sp. faydin-H76]